MVRGSYGIHSTILPQIIPDTAPSVSLMQLPGGQPATYWHVTGRTPRSQPPGKPYTAAESLLGWKRQVGAFVLF